MQVFDELMPGVEHRFCLRHLYANFKKRFGGGVVIRDLMMGAAKATYEAMWHEKMQELKALNEEAYDWLMTIPKRAWCKHAFTIYPKCDVLMNNLSEAFNATILLARDKPILTMMDWIRSYLMGRFAALNEKFQKYQGDVMPKPLKRLTWETKASQHWFPQACGHLKFEVKSVLDPDTRFIVDIGQHSCTCNWWDLVGIPCRHAVAAISHNMQQPVNFVHSYYRRDAYKATYGHAISPINGKRMWPYTPDAPILPPVYKRKAGRPKKLRRREPHEDDPEEGARPVPVHRCGRCGGTGHNVRTCPNPVSTQPTTDPIPSVSTKHTG